MLKIRPLFNYQLIQTSPNYLNILWQKALWITMPRSQERDLM